MTSWGWGTMGREQQQQLLPPPRWRLPDMALSSLRALFHTVSYLTNKTASPRTLYLQLIHYLCNNLSINPILGS